MPASTACFQYWYVQALMGRRNLARRPSFPDERHVLADDIEARAAVVGFGEDEFGESDLRGVAARVPLVEDLQHVPLRQPQPFPQRNPLAGRREDRVGHVVVDQLHHVPAAHRPDVQGPLADGLKHRQTAQVHVPIAADHEQELSGFRPGRPPGHGGVEIGDALRWPADPPWAWYTAGRPWSCPRPRFPWSPPGQPRPFRRAPAAPRQNRARR